MKKLACLVLFAAVLGSCGSSDEDDKAATAVSYGTLKTSLLASETIASYDLTGATCSSDSNSGLFTGSFTGTNGSKMEIRIKGFSTTTSTYSCTQSSDNGDGDVGQRYNGCMVEITVPDAETGLNTYAMHRSADTIKAFTYAGSCSVRTTYEAPRVTLVVDCGNMVQTMLQGAARNPIDVNVTAKVNSATTANCNI